MNYTSFLSLLFYSFYITTNSFYGVAIGIQIYAFWLNGQNGCKNLWEALYYKRYKCLNCLKFFTGGNHLNSIVLWQEYTQGKQTYTQLAQKYDCSIKTIQRKIDDYKIENHPKEPRKVIVLMDTTYWGRTFGVMLFKDAITKENLLKYFVKNETNSLYIQGIKELQDKGFQAVAIVYDGRKGLLQSFGQIPVQMCQFHQAAIIRRYLTKKPKLKAGQELSEMVDLMTITDKESFEGALEEWYKKWKDFINERSVNSLTNKSFILSPKFRP
ncbi:transposase [Bergeyella porcorum]|uniref:IS256 family transposase, variant Zn-binding type n=1 Tax=Bergeyella porcorum TaxID=1735111 RepID=UPI0035EDAA73